METILSAGFRFQVTFDTLHSASRINTQMLKRGYSLQTGPFVYGIRILFYRTDMWFCNH